MSSNGEFLILCSPKQQSLQYDCKSNKYCLLCLYFVSTSLHNSQIYSFFIYKSIILTLISLFVFIDMSLSIFLRECVFSIRQSMFVKFCYKTNVIYTIQGVFESQTNPVFISFSTSRIK